MKLPATADVVIVGGGINGGAIAYSLARLGIARIVVVEATALAHGASSRGAGIIRTYYADPAEAVLALQSLETYRNWKDEVGGECGYTPTGFLWMVGPEGVGELEANLAMLRRLGGEYELLSPADIFRLQPHIDPKGIGAAAYERSGGYGTPAAATASLHAAAGRFGAEIFEGVAATALTSRSGRVTGVATTDGSIAAPVVVLAAGAWSVPLAASAGVELPLVPTRMTTGTMRHAPFARPAMTFIDAASDVFYRPTETPDVAHVSVRDARHNSVIDFSRDWADEAVAPSASRDGIARLRRRIPTLDATPMRAWVGVDGVTADKRGVYGKVASMEGLILCVGGNYKGFKVAPAVGRHLAALIATGETPDELSSFGLDRFGSTAAPPMPPTFSLAGVA